MVKVFEVKIYKKKKTLDRTFYVGTRLNWINTHLTKSSKHV